MSIPLRRRGSYPSADADESMRGPVLLLALLLSVPFAAWPTASAEAEFPACAQPLDVLFLFDTTGSMGGVLDSAKAGAASVMANVQAQVPDAWFGVANYRDYVGFYSYPGYATTFGVAGDYPWQLNQPIGPSASAADAAIKTLAIGNGADGPESLVRAVHESSLLGWRPGSTRVVVLFADAPGHDADFDGDNYGGDPGPDALALTADDLDFQATVAQAADAGLRFVSVDSGRGGYELAALTYLADETRGSFAFLSGDFVSQVTQLILDLAPQATQGAGASALRAEASVPANPRVELARTAVGTWGGVDQATLARVTLPPPLVGEVAAAHARSEALRAHAHLDARAEALVEDVTLLGGAVKARGLHAVARSTTTPGSSLVTSAGTEWAYLEVMGTPIPDDVAPNTILAIPDGFVILKESRTVGVEGRSSEILVNALHVVVDGAQGRLDVVVASAWAGSACAGEVGELLRTRDHDAGLGGDASDDPASPTPLAAPSLVQGRMIGDDALDAYVVAAAPGEKVQAVLLPSHHAGASVRAPNQAAPSASVASYALRLRDPATGMVREESAIPFSAQRVELNVDKPGGWVVEVDRLASPPGNYTLALTVTPLALRGQDDAASGADAPDACAGALPLADGAHAGVLRDADFHDWYRVGAAIGDPLALTLKPGEDADGADFDLHLYGPGCVLLASSTLGKDLLYPGTVPKGVPDALAVLAVPVSGDYHVEVRRVNGIGNYVLVLATEDPQPTLAPLDAEPADAGSDAATARPIATPFVGQGRLPDGDAEDWYSFPVAAGQRVVATLSGSGGSNVDLRLVRPDGTLAASSTLPGGNEAVNHVAGASGTWSLRVVRLSGGGDYLLSAAILPNA